MIRKEKEEQCHDSSQNEALFSNRGNFSTRGRNRRGGRYQGPNGRNNTRQNSGQEPKVVKCFKCQQIGHIVKNCPLNKRSDQSRIAEEHDGLALDSTLKKGKPDNHWYIDSGATKHMTHQRDLITDFIEYKQPSRIYLGDKGVVKACGEGKVKLQCYDGSDDVTLTLNKVLYVPKITKNLLWVPAMTQMGAEVLFDEGKCIVQKNERKITIGHMVDNKLYMVNTEEYANPATAKAPSLEQ